MENEKRKSSAQKLRKTFVGGFALMIVMLLVLNFQIAGMNEQLGNLNDVLTGAVAADPEPSEPEEGQQPEQPEDLDMEELTGDAPYMGEADAPVTIVEWSDFRCGFCNRFFAETFSQIEENYIETGDVKFVFRHFPVVGGETEAEVTICADEQDLFWEMHDKIFSTDDYSEDELMGWITELGGNQEEFNECMESGRAEEVMKRDQQLGLSAGVQGTPGFVVNGELISGAQPYSVFEQAIEANLE